MSKSKGKNEVLVVPVENYSFKIAEEDNFYAFPSSYNRRVPEYIAFYRPRPISAITHVAAVREVKEEATINGKYRLMCFGDKFSSNGTLVELEGLQNLEENVPAAEGIGIQGSLYTTIKKIKKAETVLDL